MIISILFCFYVKGIIFGAIALRHNVFRNNDRNRHRSCVNNFYIDLFNIRKDTYRYLSIYIKLSLAVSLQA